MLPTIHVAPPFRHSCEADLGLPSSPSPASLTGRSGAFFRCKIRTFLSLTLSFQCRIPNSSTLFFSPIVPVNGKDALAQVDIFKYRFE